MRLATFNLLHGRTPGDGVVCADRLHDAVAALDAEVLAVQEVDHDQPRSGQVDQTALAADAVGAREARFVPAVVGTPGVSWRPAGPDDVPGTAPTYGIGLVSRHPVAHWRRIPLGASAARLPLLADARRPVLVRDEPRLALAAVLAPPSPVGTVVATHLSFAPGVNVLQLARLARAIRDLPDPVVLLGDLNLPGPVPGVVLRRWSASGAAAPRHDAPYSTSGVVAALGSAPDSTAPRGSVPQSTPGAAAPLPSAPESPPGVAAPQWHALARTPTFPSERPRVQFDHVLARAPVRPPVRESRAVATPVSDHRALVVELRT